MFCGICYYNDNHNIGNNETATKKMADKEPSENVAKLMTYPPAILVQNGSMDFSRAYKLMQINKHVLFDPTCSFYNSLNRLFLNNKQELIKFLQERSDMVNVFVVPIEHVGGAGSCVYLLHSCFEQLHYAEPYPVPHQKKVPALADSKDQKIIGFLGIRFAGPMIRYTMDNFVAPLELKNGHDQQAVVPSLDDIVNSYVFGGGFEHIPTDVAERNHFHLVKASEETILANDGTRYVSKVVSSFPKCFVIHPKVVNFNSIGLVDDRGIEVSILAHRVIQCFLFDERTGWCDFQKGVVKSRLEDAYDFLLYLWLLGNGYGKCLESWTCQGKHLTNENDLRVFKHKRKLAKLFKDNGEFNVGHVTNDVQCDYVGIDNQIINRPGNYLGR